MKKLLSVLLLTLALCGCGQANEEKTPAGLKTLDVATYVTELEKTEPTVIKMKYVEDGNKYEGRLTAEDTTVREQVANELKTWSLTKAEDQNKIYGTPTLYIDINAVVDANYARVAVFEGETVKVVVLTNEGFVNYDLSAETPATALETLVKDYFK